MTYTPNVPQANQRISATQPIILANFQDLDTFLTVDHISLNDASAGYHRQSHYPPLGSGGPSTGASDGAVYTKVGTDGKTELFYKYQTNGTAFTAVQFPITAVKAFGRLNDAAPILVAGSSYNVNATTSFASPNWTVNTIQPFCAAGDEGKVLVICSPIGLLGNPQPVGLVSINSTTSFTIRRNSSAATGVCFVVIAL